MIRLPFRLPRIGVGTGRRTNPSAARQPRDWDAVDQIATFRVAGRLYRGMTRAEYDDTVGAGRGVNSKNLFSLRSEGTSLAEEPESAEGYVNFGRDNPLVTGISNYLVEIDPAGLDFIERNRQGYYYAHRAIPQSHVTRVWEMQPKGEHIEVVQIFGLPGIRSMNPDADACALTAYQWASSNDDFDARVRKCGGEAPSGPTPAVRASRAASRLAERRWTLPKGQRWVRAGDIVGESRSRAANPEIQIRNGILLHHVTERDQYLVTPVPGLETFVEYQVLDRSGKPMDFSYRGHALVKYDKLKIGDRVYKIVLTPESEQKIDGFEWGMRHDKPHKQSARSKAWIVGFEEARSKRRRLGISASNY